MRAIWLTSLSVYSSAEKLLALSLLLIVTEIFTQCLPIISVEDFQGKTTPKDQPVLISSPIQSYEGTTLLVLNM